MKMHRAYYDAGSDVASANTYGAPAIKLKKMGVTQSVENVNRTGVRIAREALWQGAVRCRGTGLPWRYA